ncbi:DNA/RNA non-specific endonuclease, partial [Ligilactobacillus acidipiscis]|uniref:DNA/RNA non-specific endonuclease n=2 Tax=Ligilactobacillus acidipiscis TaxID=89059 RepID=UPI0030B814EB
HLHKLLDTPDTFFAIIWLGALIYFIFCLFNKKRRKEKTKWMILGASILAFVIFGVLTPTGSEKTASGEKTEQVSSQEHRATQVKKGKTSSSRRNKSTKKEYSNKQESIRKAQLAKKKDQSRVQQQNRASNKELAALEFKGTQTINVNNGVPTFSETGMSTKNGSWEKYGELDSLNRATFAEAMLSQATMPKPGEKRESISDVTPTGWKNKRISSGYLYNRSHLIGWALSAENDNWRNLITGTRQLNSPEMLCFEMDTKAYLEQSSTNYVRYSVTPIFRGNELLARGVHMMARSVGDNKISFNVFIFNVQDGVKLNYADGSSNVSGAAYTGQTPNSDSYKAANNDQVQQNEQTQQNDEQNMRVYVTPTGDKYHTHPHGRGHFTPTTLKDAKASGLQPCKICNPPS